MSWADFDRYCDEHDVQPGGEPEAFAQWLADKSGQAIIGGPVDEPPTVVAIPESDKPA